MNSRLLAGVLLCSSILTAAPRHFMRAHGALTAASTDAPQAIAQRFLEQAAPLYGLSPADLPSLYLLREYKTDHNGVTHLIYRQRYAGIDVAHADFVVNVAADGSILNAGGRMYSAPASDHAPPPESLSPSIRAAMRWGDPSAGDYVPIEVQSKGNLRRFARTDGRGDIEGRPIWYSVNGRLRPAWQFYLNAAGGRRAATVVDSDTQTILEARPLTFNQDPAPPRGLVFTGQSPQPNPRPGVRMTEPPPYVDRLLVSFSGDPQASPAGWVGGSETRGNNVIAGKNPLGVLFLIDPITAKSETRDFHFPLELGPGAPNPTHFIEAATVNLFYWMNRSHDMFWHIGFNEAAGNYQTVNFGRGGIEGDPIYAYSQFGVQQTVRAGLNNAFYTTRGLEDGSPAMIAMYIGAGTNGVFSDGSYDTEVIIHEYAHGVSLRLVRDLDGFHGGAMGEAWSDFYALEFTVPEGAPIDGTYPVGDYLFQQFNVGIRPRPYSTDMSVNPTTFADLGRVSDIPEVHYDATIWMQPLWEMRANLIRQFGEREGRRRVRLLVIDGMKLSVPSPTMVEARDAILLADRVNFNGASQQQIWEAFAKRGMGVTAWARSIHSTSVSASFDRPGNRGTLAFSSGRYVLGEPLRIILHDENLTGDVAIVQVTSGQAGDLETIRLRREGSIYTGTLSTSTATAATHENGILSVVPGATPVAYYGDADAGGAFQLVETQVATQPNYVRLGRQPNFQFFDERPLPLRGVAGQFTTVELPFPFPFFGRDYSAVQVHPIGLLTFDLPSYITDFLIGFPVCFDAATLGDTTGIAPLLADLRTNGTAQPNENVYVSRPSENAVTFRWAGETNPLPGAAAPEPVNFAVTLNRDGRIEFHYGPGNRTLSFPTIGANAFGCPVQSPVVGISNGSGVPLALATDYTGRTNLENAPGVIFDPPSGASSAPSIRIEVPNQTDTYEGILQGRITVWDASHPVLSPYILIDGTFRGRAAAAARPAACDAERLPNCSGWAATSNFETLQLEPGTHTLKVIVINSRGGVSEQEVTFTVGSGQSRVPRAEIETPVEGAELTGNLTFRGWAAADNLRVVAVDVLIDGVNYGRAQYGLSRPDVCQTLGFTSPNCPNVGFTFSVNSATGAIPLPNGEHLVQIRIQDETGRFTFAPETPLSFRVNNEANTPPAGVLVTPRHNERVSGTVHIYGYAWDPDGTVRTVQLLLDGSVRATLPYGEARPSECEALPDVEACPNIGFWFEWNSRTVLNGPHVLGIRLIDDRGRATIIPQNAESGLTVIVDNQ